MKKALLLCLATLLLSALYAEDVTMRELRATWVTTVWGIDWPSTQVNTSGTESYQEKCRNQQKQELCTILDSLKAAGMNAAFFQVRGMSDAMYESPYENWSRYLTGIRGKNPGYDPLKFAIEEAHKRGIELHAWLNPYRYASSTDTYSDLDNDYAKMHPEWILNHPSGAAILDPGLPEVRQRIQEIIADIVNRYDVDGIVFDDYFYPYGGTSSDLDAETQKKYKPIEQSIGDWRRENVNKMIKDVYDTIQVIKPYVKFGVSPFGTWTTDKNVAAKEGITLPGGVSNTGNMYAEIYCDPVAWMKAGTIDYISPQIYWTTYSPYPYGKLSDWWSQLSNRFGCHFYSSHSVSALSAKSMERPERPGMSSIENYAMQEKLSECKNIEKVAPQQRAFGPSEMLKQVEYNREYDLNDAPGSVFYNTGKTIKTRGFVKYLREVVFKTKAITPHINWKNSEVPEIPTNFVKKENVLSWSLSDSKCRTLIYAVPSGYKGAAKYSSNHLIDITYVNTYTIPAEYTSGFDFAIIAFDRYGAMSAPVMLGGKADKPSVPTLSYPENNSKPLLPCVFKWDSVPGEWIEYQWQLSEDKEFMNITVTRTTKRNEFNTTIQNNILGDKTYFWRVRTISEGGVSDWSEVFQFTSKLFGINSPVNGASNLEVTPTIEWDEVSNDALYTLEIATDLSFGNGKLIFTREFKTTSYKVEEGILNHGMTYYARVSVKSNKVESMSPTVTFYTKDLPVPIPEIISPKNGETIIGKSIVVEWKKQVSNGFRVELSTSDKFPPRGSKIKTVNSAETSCEYTNMKYDTYFVRMRANSAKSYTEYSDTVKFVLAQTTDIESLKEGNAMIVYLNEDNIAVYAGVDSKEITDIRIYNISGQEIKSVTDIDTNCNNYFCLNTNNLDNGIFILKIRTKSGDKILKFKK